MLYHVVLVWRLSCSLNSCFSLLGICLSDIFKDSCPCSPVLIGLLLRKSVSLWYSKTLLISPTICLSLPFCKYGWWAVSVVSNMQGLGSALRNGGNANYPQYLVQHTSWLHLPFPWLAQFPVMHDSILVSLHPCVFQMVCPCLPCYLGVWPFALCISEVIIFFSDMLLILAVDETSQLCFFSTFH